MATLGSIVWALYCGKDVGWDQVNYHLYAGYTAFDFRLDKDLFAANGQGYLNRLSFVPLALLAKSGVGSIYVASILAALQSVALWCCFSISSALPRPEGRLGRMLPTVSVVLTALCPIYFIQSGSSANDITTAIPVLGAWALMLNRSERSSRTIRLSFAGTLLGCAAGLKMTTGVFAVASIPLLFLDTRQFARHAACWVAGGIVGFAATEGWWALTLWREFGNPFFPLFNSFFQSPDVTVDNPVSQRFRLTDWHDIWRQPFLMALPERGRYIELSAPDVRYATAFVVLAVLGIAGAVLSAMRRIHVWRDYRAELLTGLVFVGAWTAWQTTSGAGRYMAALALATGPFLVCWVAAISKRDRVVAYSLLAVVLVQLMSSVLGSSNGRTGLDWNGPWVQVRVPEDLQAEPHLIIGGAIQSFSIILPFVHPDSAMVTVSGQEVVRPGTRAGDRVIRKMQAFADRMVYLERSPPEPIDGNQVLSKFGLEVNEEACGPVEIPQYAERVFRTPDGGRLPSDIALRVCQVRPRAKIDPDYERQFAEVKAVLAAVRRACPTVFGSEAGHIDGADNRWRILFLQRDAQMTVLDGQVSLSNFQHRTYSKIGSTADWINGTATVNCNHFPTKKVNDLSEYFTAEELNGMGGGGGDASK